MGWFDTVDLEASIGDDAYKAAQDRHELSLGALQRRLRDAETPSVILIDGWDAVGKGKVLGHLLHLLDPRWYRVVTATVPTREEEQRPWLWRYWRHAPRNGTILLLDQGWYRPLLDATATGELDGEALRERCRRIRVFERQWAADGIPVLKFFLHITREEQAKRFDGLRARPAFAWRVGEEEERRHKAYEAYCDAMERILTQTHAPSAPWTVVPATDVRLAGTMLSDQVEHAFEHALAPRPLPIVMPPPDVGGTPKPLEQVDHGVKLARKEYKAILPTLQQELRRLQHLCYEKRLSMVLVYEGQDAAGKGGNIRRLVREMDPRGYTVIPTAAPEGEEKLRHYLWRFWRDLPRDGHFAIFDRSWYGRVLVERIEGFAKPHEWARAYREINEFEEELVRHGTVIVKFWIDISKDEQADRFKAREKTPHKQWKMTDEDWRNRKKWKEYAEATNDMLVHTSTDSAPWHLIEGNDKPHARVKACRVVIDALRHALGEPEAPSAD